MAIRPRVVESAPGLTERVLRLSQRISKEPTLFAWAAALREGLRTVVGLERVAIYLRSPSGKALTGLIGTDLEGKLIDERHLRHAVDPTDETLWSDSIEGKRCFEVREDAPWVVNQGDEPRVVGRGWFVRTPLVAEDVALGFIYNDSAITHQPLDRPRQELTATLGMLVAPRLRLLRDRAALIFARGASKAVSECVELLVQEPSSTNAELARLVGVPVQRLSREFQRDMGTSLIEYRIELRLQRFFELVESAEREGSAASLLDLALRAGFGSYSQFHRIFSARFGVPPSRHSPGAHENESRATQNRRSEVSGVD